MKLTVPLGGDVAEAFHRAHEERYGFADRDRPLELATVRTAEVSPAPELDLRTAERRSIAGPALLELAGSTCWVPEDWSGETDEHGTLVLRR